MTTICGLDCCDNCPFIGKNCRGCGETGGHPCGGTCIAAEYITVNGCEAFILFKRQIIDEINSLSIDGLTVSDLNLLNGSFVNLAYPLPGGKSVKLLDDARVYLGNQIERPDNDRCYGVVADETMILACEYGCMGSDPVLLCYRKRV